jgi:hypothetical protein
VSGLIIAQTSPRAATVSDVEAAVAEPAADHGGQHGIESGPADLAEVIGGQVAHWACFHADGRAVCEVQLVHALLNSLRVLVTRVQQAQPAWLTIGDQEVDGPVGGGRGRRVEADRDPGNAVVSHRHRHVAGQQSAVGLPLRDAAEPGQRVGRHERARVDRAPIGQRDHGR